MTKSTAVTKSHVGLAIALGMILSGTSMIAFSQGGNVTTTASAPFTEFSGGDYLNAVYSGDFDQVHVADVKYFEGYDAVNSMVSQELTSLGLGGLAETAFDRANFSLVVPVITVYLMNYGQTSRSCLRPGFKDFVVNTTLVTVKQTPWGGKIVDDFGVVGVSRYPVNKEFIPAFSVLGTTEPEGNALPDAVLNDNKINRLFLGIRTMMARIPCNDARIVRFERNILALYNNREANRRKVIADREKYFREREQKESAVFHACNERLNKLNLEPPFAFDFRTKCEKDPASITAADIERWQNGPKEAERYRNIFFGDNPRFTQAGTYIRGKHCQPLEAGGDAGLRSMQCMLEYQPTEKEIENIRQLDEMRINRGQKP